ncbi:hypothetical protein ACWGMA_20225 [Streptomyces asiaticus]
MATAELAAAGRKVLLLGQEPESNLGGQAFWSFGGLFFVDSEEQRLMGAPQRPHPQDPRRPPGRPLRPRPGRLRTPDQRPVRGR